MATFFGGPLAIVYILAENFRQFGDQRRVKKTWIIGIGLTLFFFIAVAYMASSPRIPNLIVPLISILTGTAVMQSWQGTDIQLHVDSGGRIYTLSRALLIGLLSLVATVIFLITLSFFYVMLFGEPAKR